MTENFKTNIDDWENLACQLPQLITSAKAVISLSGESYRKRLRDAYPLMTEDDITWTQDNEIAKIAAEYKSIQLQVKSLLASVVAPPRADELVREAKKADGDINLMPYVK